MVKRRTAKRTKGRKSGHRSSRTPRAGARARMTGTQPTRRSARLAAKKRLSMKGLLNELENIETKTFKSAVGTVRGTRRVVGKTLRKTTKRATNIAKKMKTMSVNDLSKVFSAFKM